MIIWGFFKSWYYFIITKEEKLFRHHIFLYVEDSATFPCLSKKACAVQQMKACVHNPEIWLTNIAEAP